MTLIRCGREIGYPLGLLTLGVLQCLAARHVRVGRSYSRATQPLKSIVAGLGEANNMARIIVHGLAAQVAVGNPQVSLNTFVDDMSQTTSNTSAAQVAVDLGKVARQLAGGLQQLGSTLSDKSVLFCSIATIAKALKATMGGLGVKLSWVQSAADIGLDINDAKGNNKMHAKKEAGRIRKAVLTTKKVIKLQAKRKIINTVVLPRVAYSVVARGYAPSTLQRLRGQAASAGRRLHYDLPCPLWSQEP